MNARLAVTWLAVALLTAPALAQVTEEDIAAQAAEVRAAQAALDSLQSLAKAEAWQAVVDSNATLADASVVVSLVAAAPGTGLRDPQYVSIETPYSTWASADRRLWGMELRDSGIGAIARGELGSYAVHNGEVAAFLALIEEFVAALEEEE